MIHLTINDRALAVAEGRTLLEACREHDIHVPTLCYHPALEPYGACRLCLVELVQPGRPGKLVPACTYPCEAGAVVATHSPAVQRSRRITAELLLAGAGDSPEVVALGRELGVRAVRYRLPEADVCVLCGLCVRACREIVGANAISLARRGLARQVSPPFEVASGACIACGTCVLICPTGAIQLSDVTGRRGVHPAGSAYDREYCRVCDVADLTPRFVEDPDALLSGDGRFIS
jgi:NADH dehydrogenase/NADH:ubiquinone oxidoreductase subunit G